MKKKYLLLSFLLFSVSGIMNAQQVGINTKTPTKMLDVNGNARIRNITTDNTAPNIIVADNQGNIGSISKTSIIASEIDGIIGNEVTKANNGLQITGSGTASDPLTVGLGGTLSKITNIAMNSNNLNFTGSGNLGIGTNTPSTKLDINGSLKSNSSVILSGLTNTSNQTYATVVADSSGNLYKKEEVGTIQSNVFKSSANNNLYVDSNTLVAWQASGNATNIYLPDPAVNLNRVLYLICTGVYGNTCPVSHKLTYANGAVYWSIPPGKRVTIISTGSLWGWVVIAKDF